MMANALPGSVLTLMVALSASPGTSHTERIQSGPMSAGSVLQAVLHALKESQRVRESPSA